MNPKKILIIGGGGHAKVVINLILESGLFRPEGILDSRLQGSTRVLGVPVCGSDADISHFQPDQVCLALGVGMMRASALRMELYNHFKVLGFTFPVLVHPQTCVGKNVAIADGVQVMAHVTIQPEAKISHNCILNTGAVVEHDVIIGAHSHIAPGAVIGGGAIVGDRSLVGLGARILPGVNIGRDVTVGAGAVVVRDIPDNYTVVGTPACPI